MFFTPKASKFLSQGVPKAHNSTRSKIEGSCVEWFPGWILFLFEVDMSLFEALNTSMMMQRIMFLEIWQSKKAQIYDI